MKITQGGQIPAQQVPGSKKPETVLEKKLMEVAQKFEAIFVNQMVTSMRKTVEKGGLVPESHAERIYESMLDEQHSNSIADSGQLGLSNMIYEHLLRTEFRR